MSTLGLGMCKCVCLHTKKHTSFWSLGELSSNLDSLGM